MAPQMRMHSPAGVPDRPGFPGVTFAVDWKAVSADYSLYWWSPGDHVMTLSAGLRLGWLLTHWSPGTDASSSWWLVLKPSLGFWNWWASTEDFGTSSSVSLGFGCHLNEFNTIGLDYVWVNLWDTHGGENTTLDGLTVRYSIKF